MVPGPEGSGSEHREGPRDWLALILKVYLGLFAGMAALVLLGKVGFYALILLGFGGGMC